MLFILLLLTIAEGGGTLFVFVLAPPIVLVYGIAGLYDPRIIIAWWPTHLFSAEAKQAVPESVKKKGLVAAGVGGVIGLFVVFLFFG